MYTASIKCTEDELCILEKKFMNVDGFNYLQFLKMLIDINKKLKKCSVSNTIHQYVYVPNTRIEYMSITELGLGRL